MLFDLKLPPPIQPAPRPAIIRLAEPWHGRGVRDLSRAHVRGPMARDVIAEIHRVHALNRSSAILPALRDLARHVGFAAALPGMTLIPAGGVAEAFPVVEDAVEGAESSVTTSYSASLPPGISSGDLLVMFAAVGSGSNRTITDPSGWTLFWDAAAVGNIRDTKGWYRVADGSEGASVSISASGLATWAHGAYRISGADTSTAPEEGTAATGTGTNANPPSVAPSWGSAKNLFLTVMFGRQGATSNVTAAPTSYMNLREGGDTSQNNSVVGGFAQRQLEASSDDPGPFTSTSLTDWIAQTVAIRPA